MSRVEQKEEWIDILLIHRRMFGYLLVFRQADKKMKKQHN